MSGCEYAGLCLFSSLNMALASPWMSHQAWLPFDLISGDDINQKSVPESFLSHKSSIWTHSGPTFFSHLEIGLRSLCICRTSAWRLLSNLPSDRVTGEFWTVYLSPDGSDGRVCLQCGRPEFNLWVRKIPWRRKWQSTTVNLPGKSHGWRSLAGYSS